MSNQTPEVTPQDKISTLRWMQTESERAGDHAIAASLDGDINKYLDQMNQGDTA